MIAGAPDLRRSGCQRRSTGSMPNCSVIEKVRRFILADEPFTVENEQLTPSMKIRRHVIRSAYGERLDALSSARSSSDFGRAQRGRTRRLARPCHGPGQPGD